MKYWEYKIVLHAKAAWQVRTKTAAEPRSFARPARGWNSFPYRSTMVSTAELSNSTAIINITDPTRIIFSIGPFPIQSPTGPSNAKEHTSSLNEASVCHAARSPWADHFSARHNPGIPLGRTCFMDVRRINEVADSVMSAHRPIGTKGIGAIR